MDLLQVNKLPQGNILVVQGGNIIMLKIKYHSTARDHFLEGKQHAEEKKRLATYGK